MYNITTTWGTNTNNTWWSGYRTNVPHYTITASDGTVLYAKSDFDFLTNELESFWDGPTYVVRCKEKTLLTMKNILDTISRMKDRITYECRPFQVDHIECVMSPEIKNRLIKANKRSKMYGLVTPKIANFDEYGRRLPDTLPTVFGMQIFLQEATTNYLELRMIPSPLVTSSICSTRNLF